jgi:hypothetical protein
MNRRSSNALPPVLQLEVQAVDEHFLVRRVVCRSLTDSAGVELLQFLFVAGAV